MSKITGATLMARSLKQQGIDHLFGRDLRRDGWFVDEGLVARGRRGPSFRQESWPGPGGTCCFLT